MPLQSVRDLLRVRHSHVVSESALLRDVAERLIISDCDVMAVVDDRQRLVGILCESAVVRALLASPSDGATVQSIVTRHAESVRQDAPLTSALPLFRASAHTAIPVVDQDGCVCGLLMRRDVIGTLLNRRLDDAEFVQATSAASSTIVMNPPANRPPKTRVTESNDPRNNGMVPPSSGPHFLRADAARRLLWAAEDRL